VPGKSKQQPSGKLHSRDRAKERRATSWARGKVRSKEHAAEQHDREVANNALRAAGQPTPWEAACAARHERRRPLQEAYRIKVHRERARI
jgi:hypothetical protein